MILQLVDKDSPILRQEMPIFDFSNPPINPVDLYNNMGETMLAENGLGLSANQVGLPYRMFVIRASEVIGVFNPKIVDQSEEQIYLEEGCLSYPGLFVKIKRPKKIKTRFTLPNGEIVTKVFDGLTARCFQHELDHLNGLLYNNRASKFHLDRAKQKAKQVARGNLKISINSKVSENTQETLRWLK